MKHEPQPRRSSRLRAITAIVTALIVVFTFVVADPVATPARAAGPLLINSNIMNGGNDANPGDGICADAAGRCTMRAAVTEANGLNGNVVISVAAGTVAITNACSTGNLMTSTAVEGGGSGAFYVITAPDVTIDFDNRLTITGSIACAAAMFSIQGPRFVAQNGTGVLGSAFVFSLGSAADDSLIANMTFAQTANNFTATAVGIGSGADGVTIRGSTFSGMAPDVATSGMIRFGGNAVVANTSILGNRFTTGASTTCDTTGGSGCRAHGISGTATTISGLKINGNTFTGFQSARAPIGFTGTSVAFDGLDIAMNKFTGTANTTTAAATIGLPTKAMTGTNRIRGNTFDATSSAYALYWLGVATGGATNSNLAVTDNYFNGYSTSAAPAVSFSATGSVLFDRNIFGNSTGGSATGNAAESGSSSAVILLNSGTAANSQIRTWRLATATLNACTLTVTTTAPPATAPVAPATLNLYWSRNSSLGAEIFLGSVQASSATATPTFTIPFSSSLANGVLRIQTIGAPRSPGTQQQSSQYSRALATSIAATGTSCRPGVTVNQAVGQDDPTSVRDVKFRVISSAPLLVSSLVPADFVVGGTATGTQVATVTALNTVSGSASQFEVTARTNSSGTIILSLPDGAAVAAAGSVTTTASTSTDNSVTFVNPLDAVPTSITVYEGGPSVPYAITRTRLIPPRAALSVPVSANTAYASAPTPVTLSTSALSASVPVTSGALGGVDRTTVLSHTAIVSTDAQYNGLLVPPVTVSARRAATLTPTTGPVSGGTAVAIAIGAPPAAVTGITFGGTPATFTGTAAAGTLVATTPARTPTGANEVVTVVITYANGATTTLPAAFTYVPRPAITITKLGYADAARTQLLANGGVILVDTRVYWRYTVTNSGQTALTGVTVTDLKLPAASYPGGLVCTVPSLAMGASTSCNADAVVVP